MISNVSSSTTSETAVISSTVPSLRLMSRTSWELIFEFFGSVDCNAGLVATIDTVGIRAATNGGIVGYLGIFDVLGD